MAANKPNILVLWGDDDGNMGLRLDDWKLVLMEQRANH
jgi:hypothetical protein